MNSHNPLKTLALALQNILRHPIWHFVNVQCSIQGNNDAANLARQIQAYTNVTMEMEVMKLPDFYGDPSKDTITAL